MDDHRFDALTRSLSSRRIALGGAAGAIAALVGLVQPDDADAHSFLTRCRRIQNPPRRRACLRRARAHNRTCHPQSVARTCAGRCGPVTNNCGKAVACSCPVGQVCQPGGTCCMPQSPAIICAPHPCGATLYNNCGQVVTCPGCASGKDCINGRCAQRCVGGCPASCSCGGTTTYGVNYCVESSSTIDCSFTPDRCTADGSCDPGYYCGLTSCGFDGGPERRCLPHC